MAATIAKKKTAGKKAPRRKKKTKSFQFQLSIAEVAGIGVVVFCLFLWMFLLGIWAGQTILLPQGDVVALGRKHGSDERAHQAGSRLIRPRAVKKRVRP